MTTATKNGAGSTPMTLAELVAQPLPFELVDVAEYGEGKQVRLNAISGRERARLSTMSNAAKTSEDRIAFQHELVATAIGDGATAEQVALLPGGVIDRLGGVALRLAGIGDAAVTEAEQQVKATPSADSGSA